MIIFFDRDGEALEEISSNLSFPSLGLEEEGSYSCAGVNYLGTGEFATVIIDVIGRIIDHSSLHPPNHSVPIWRIRLPPS